MALLHPKRRAEVFRIDSRMNVVDASHVFRARLYRDEEQTPFEQRAALSRGPLHP